MQEMCTTYATPSKVDKKRLIGMLRDEGYIADAVFPRFLPSRWMAYSIRTDQFYRGRVIGRINRNGSVVVASRASGLNARKLAKIIEEYQVKPVLTAQTANA